MCPLLPLLLTVAEAVPLDPAAQASLGVLVVVSPIIVDTDALTLSSVAGSGVVVDGVAVFTFDDVDLQSTVFVTGSRPAAILSKGSLSVGGAATVAANATGTFPGGGGHRGGAANGEFGLGPCGGASDGAGAGGGANGGDGGTSAQGTPGGAACGDPAVLLTGGSGGARSNNATYPPAYNSDGGAGGGALELGALGRVDLAGVVDVRGGDGVSWWYNDGGGGGAGGSLLVHGAGGSCTATVLASGGAGGAGYVAAGGGGGGRVTFVGFAPTCVPDVSGGDGALGWYHYATYEPSGLPGAPGVVVVDEDGDGFSGGQGDCDDLDAQRSPGLPEVRCDGLDNDCDGGTADDPGGCGHTGATDTGATAETGPTGSPTGETAGTRGTGATADTGAPATSHTGAESADTASDHTDGVDESDGPPLRDLPPVDPGCGCGQGRGPGPFWWATALVPWRRRRA